MYIITYYYIRQGQKQSGFPGSGRDGGKKKQEVKISTSYSMHWWIVHDLPHNNYALFCNFIYMYAHVLSR